MADPKLGPGVDGGSIYAINAGYHTPCLPNECCRIQPGLTIRDWFAGQALATLGLDQDNTRSMGDPDGYPLESQVEHAEWLAGSAYRIADAMLAERSK